MWYDKRETAAIVVEVIVGVVVVVTGEVIVLFRLSDGRG